MRSTKILTPRTEKNFSNEIQVVHNRLTTWHTAYESRRRKSLKSRFNFISALKNSFSVDQNSKPRLEILYSWNEFSFTDVMLSLETLRGVWNIKLVDIEKFDFKDRDKSTQLASFGIPGLSNFWATKQKYWFFNGKLLYKLADCDWDLDGRNQGYGYQHEKVWASGRFNIRSIFSKRVQTFKYLNQVPSLKIFEMIPPLQK